MGTNPLQAEYEASQCRITSLQEELDDMRFLNSSLVNESMLDKAEQDRQNSGPSQKEVALQHKVDTLKNKFKIKVAEASVRKTQSDLKLAELTKQILEAKEAFKTTQVEHDTSFSKSHGGSAFGWASLRDKQNNNQ